MSEFNQKEYIQNYVKDTYNKYSFKLRKEDEVSQLLEQFKKDNPKKFNKMIRELIENNKEFIENYHKQ